MSVHPSGRCVAWAGGCPVCGDHLSMRGPTRLWQCVKVTGAVTIVEHVELTEEELQDRLDTGWIVTPLRGTP